MITTEVVKGLKIASASSPFAASLLSGYTKYGSFTVRQLPHAERIAQQALGLVQTNVEVINVAGISSLFNAAIGNKIKRPRIKLDGLKFAMAGERSRYNGKIMIDNGLPYGTPENKWFGYIDLITGEFTPKNTTPEIVQRIKEFAAKPAETARAYGLRTGNCCFCARTLIETVSVDVGYGPICAQKYNLPH
jgi:hypothetical protein